MAGQQGGNVSTPRSWDGLAHSVDNEVQGIMITPLSPEALDGWGQLLEDQAGVDTKDLVPEVGCVKGLKAGMLDVEMGAGGLKDALQEKEIAHSVKPALSVKPGVAYKGTEACGQ